MKTELKEQKRERKINVFFMVLLCVWAVRNIIGGVATYISMQNEISLTELFGGQWTGNVFEYWWKISCHFAVALSFLATVIFQNCWGTYTFVFVTVANIIVQGGTNQPEAGLIGGILIMIIYGSLLKFCKKDGVSALDALEIMPSRYNG